VENDKHKEPDKEGEEEPIGCTGEMMSSEREREKKEENK
jgi:hypothetical protein